MPDTLHVTHAVLSLDTGGLERIVVDLVRHGRELGQEVSVVCVERPGVLAPQAEALGARLTELTPAQAAYIDVPVEGPYKPDLYRY